MDPKCTAQATEVAKESVRVLVVLTRAIPAAPASGRERTLSSIERALSSQFDVSRFVLEDLAHNRSVARCLRTMGSFVLSLLKLRPKSLQVLLFHDPAGHKRLFRAIDEFKAQVVYFDSVRSVDWLVATRRRYPEMNLICDFDDLMSLRFERLLKGRFPISLGYLESVTPTWIRSSLRRGAIVRLLLAYETQALRAAELMAQESASTATVVSEIDADELRRNVGYESATKTRVVLPCVSFPSPGIRTVACREFVFVGSDSLLQNRLSIEFLIGLWSTLLPRTPLTLVGRMRNQYPACGGVRFCGFVEEIDSVYSSECIALCPTFVEGGIKTKILEALGQGVIPVGNDLAFSGMGCDAGNLVMSDEGFRNFVLDPEPQLAQLRESAIKLRDCVYNRCSSDAVAAAWRSLVVPDRGA